MYDVLDVSRYVINYSNDMNYGVSNLKLQKLLYLIQSYFLITTNTPCFKENIEAWSFGAVVPKAYKEYKGYGGCDILSIETYLEFDEKNIWKTIKRIRFNDKVISKKDKEKIKEVVDKFSDYTAVDLTSMTCGQDPWINAYVSNTKNIITNESIKDYFDGKRSQCSETKQQHNYFSIQRWFKKA